MGSNKLTLLAISDTHLGEETSLLSFPRGLQQLWQTLAKNTDFWRPIFPDFNASSIIAKPIRSFTLESGLKNSSFSKISACAPCAAGTRMRYAA